MLVSYAAVYVRIAGTAATVLEVLISGFHKQHTTAILKVILYFSLL